LRRLRDSPIVAVVLTGTEVDQTAGLLTLRERAGRWSFTARRHEAPGIVVSGIMMR
jgi:chemotaxis response regulator CheB